MSALSQTVVASRTRVSRPGSGLAWRLFLYVLLALGVVIFAFPFAWMVSTSLKPASDVFTYPPTLIPATIEWGNYVDVLHNFPFVQGLTNTLIIIIGVEIGRLISVPLAAYAFARFRFPGREPLFLLVLATMMLPGQVLLIPQYLVFRNLGWLNTFLPLIVPSLFAGGSLGAFAIFLLRQFFLSIPREYAEAAEIDGCGFMGVYWHIILPLSVPALAVMAIFTFMQEWNDFFGPLIYLTSTDKFTLALSFQIWSQTQQTGLGYKPEPFNAIMAVATLITLVPIAVFFLSQRIFIRGVVISGVKA
jgi:ABC-type glycerol-3-phosphate transport system permease component